MTFSTKNFESFICKELNTGTLGSILCPELTISRSVIIGIVQLLLDVVFFSQMATLYGLSRERVAIHVPLFVSLL